MTFGCAGLCRSLGITIDKMWLTLRWSAVERAELDSRLSLCVTFFACHRIMCSDRQLIEGGSSGFPAAHAAGGAGGLRLHPE
jgi:hypothetical protein